MIDIAQVSDSTPSRARSYLICAASGGVVLAAVCVLDQWAVTFLVLLMLLLVPPLLEYRVGHFDILGLQTMVALGYFLDFVVATLYSLYIAPRFFDPESLRSVLPLVLTVASIGLFCFHVGFYSPIGRALANVLPKLKDRWTSRGVIITSASFLVLGSVFYVVLMIEAGGFEYFEAHLYNANEMLMGTYYLELLSKGLLSYAFFVSYIWARTKRSRVAEGVSYVILAAVVAGFAALGSRGTITLLVLCSAFVVHYLSRWSRRDTVFIALTVLFLVIVMPVYSIYRHLEASGLDAATLAARAIEERNEASFAELIFRRFYGVESLALIVDKVGKTAELREPGDIFLSIPREFIPRAWWPDKPVGVGFQFIETFLPREFGDRLVAGPPTLVGELYWNLALPGVVMGMFAMGVMAKCGNDWFAKNRGMLGLAIYFPFANLFLSINEGAVASRLANDMAPFLMAALVAELIMRMTRGTKMHTLPGGRA